MRVLFVASEVHPLIKTGGLADVAGALPPTLHALGLDVTVMMPAYPDAKARARDLGDPVALSGMPGDVAASLIPARLPDHDTPLVLVDSPVFDRMGNPYVDSAGHDWPDNALRFAVLSKAAALAALDPGLPGGGADVVHGSDWQTGLVPAYLHHAPGARPATVFTIHNIQFQGLFPPSTVTEVGLPASDYSIDGLEYWGRASYLKAGLVYSDAITTVSPTYAEEIKSAPGGCGMEGILSARAERLSGILNGADYHAWNPSTDPNLPAGYDIDHMDGKAVNKRALQVRMGLEIAPDAPLFAMVARFTEQKGVDLVLGAIPRLLDAGGQLILVGTGDHGLQGAVETAGSIYPGRVASFVGYSEELAHQVQGAADFFLVPSRAEPCGLTQLYALRYGTLPVVRRTGGLADTVVDVAVSGKGTGVVFDAATVEAVAVAMERAVTLYKDKRKLTATRKRAMKRDFGWRASAEAYARLYSTLVRPGDGA